MHEIFITALHLYDAMDEETRKKIFDENDQIIIPLLQKIRNSEEF